MTDTGVDRKLLVEWEDPAPAAARIPTMPGIDYVRGFLDGSFPMPPIARLLGFELTEAEPGRVVLECEAGEQHYNLIGTVHGGLACTLLDSALGCAVQTTLQQGQGYTSIDIDVRFLRPILAGSGRLRCEGTVTKPGSRVAFAEATLVDGQGRLVATATSSLAVFALQ
ncbi:PaaI family thioesterase [Gryllotalpicola ginsengisoli]|uniref:PaaI family thioesterase n=1 Tax=Gryllotalpicola ginsengisoli TaxID=444608 RepID=UPI0003B48494|nr:PaaI family thioesterase [Gryllotalpicola ginsengisoli]